MKQFRCLLVKSLSLIVFTLGFSVFLISDPTTESISLGVKGDAWLRLSNDSLRLLKMKEVEVRSFAFLCGRASLTRHPAIAIVDLELLFLMLISLCTQPADWDILWGKEMEKRPRKRLYLESISGCGAGDVEIREIVRLWLDHACGKDELIKILRSVSRALFHRSFRYRFGRVTTIFGGCNTACYPNDRMAFAMKFLSARTLAAVDCCGSRRLRVSLASCCRLCCRASTVTVRWRPSLLESWASFRHRARGRGGFRRPRRGERWIKISKNLNRTHRDRPTCSENKL